MSVAVSIASLLLLTPAWAGNAEAPTHDRNLSRNVSAAPQPLIAPDQAIAAAVNDLSTTTDGCRVRHPLHLVDFTTDGVNFHPRRGGPDWRWRLVEAAGLQMTAAGDVVPLADDSAHRVWYDRGPAVPVIEEYVLGRDSVEQRFIICEGAKQNRSDLVIVGAVECNGTFEASAQGWVWRNDDGVVSLGQVRVIDAANQLLPASMSVTANGTTIVVDGAALADAIYPVTIDPEIGTNDFRISSMGPDGDIDYDALRPAVAYNGTANEYLVVWAGDDNAGTVVDGEFEICGQRINAATGAAVGTNDFRISDMGIDSDTLLDAERPAVAWNSIDNTYLVVWSGDDDTAPLVNGESEIFGQRIGGGTGAELGTNDFRISDMGPNGNGSYDAFAPDVAYNPTNSEFLVVWQGDDNTAPLVDGESEIFGQRIVGATGAEIGTNDFRISDMGPNGDVNYDAEEPAIAWSSMNNQYLVVWSGDDNTGLIVNGESEIFGQLLSGRTAIQTGVNDFRISTMGTDGDTLFDAFSPEVAYNPTSNEFFVTWEADDDSSGLVNGEFEIYFQRIDDIGNLLENDDVRLSDMGETDGSILFNASSAAVASGGATGWFVAWQGDDDLTGVLSDDEFEIYAQRVTTAGAEAGTNDFRISDMGPNGDSLFDAQNPAVAYNPTNNQYLVVWEGEENIGLLADGEFEIFGQRLDGATGAEIGVNDFRISDMGPDGDSTLDAQRPAVAYNSLTNEYLVVWDGDDGALPLVNNEFEIFGQRISAATGVEVGTNDFRISDMGPDGIDIYDAERAAVACNTSTGEYLVVWAGDDNSGLIVDGESEIFGQWLNGLTGAAIGTNDFRISDMGTDGDVNFDAFAPAVVFNSVHNEFLVAWEGEDNLGTQVDGETEIFVQRLSGATGAEIGLNDIRISHMGPDGDPLFDANEVSVAFNSANDEYMVVWSADGGLGLADGESEIFGQRLDGATGVEIGDDDFRLSDMGSVDGDPLFDALEPAVAFGPANEVLVVWDGDDNTGALGNDEFEIYGQRYATAAPCPADLTSDGSVDAGDLGVLLGAWGACGSCAADLDGDGVVTAADLSILLGAWGTCGA